MRVVVVFIFYEQRKELLHERVKIVCEAPRIKKNLGSDIYFLSPELSRYVRARLNDA